MTIKNDKLYLQSRIQDSRNYNWSINIFLQSLAEAKGEKSIAILLSGDGADGVQGISFVHNAGGMVIVQDPETCFNPGMVEQAIATGYVDNILKTSEMPDAVIKHANTILKNANEAQRLKSI